MNDEQRTTTHGSMTITAFGKDVADATLGEVGKRRQANADLLREANGGSDDLTRGPHSGATDSTVDPRTASELKDALANLAGPEAVERRRFDKATGQG